MVLDQDYRPTVLLYEIVIYLYASRTSSPCRDYIINTNTMQTGIFLTLAEAAGRYNVTVPEFEALTGLKA